MPVEIEAHTVPQCKFHVSAKLDFKGMEHGSNFTSCLKHLDKQVGSKDSV